MGQEDWLVGSHHNDSNSGTTVLTINPASTALSTTNCVRTSFIIMILVVVIVTAIVNVMLCRESQWFLVSWPLRNLFIQCSDRCLFVLLITSAARLM